MYVGMLEERVDGVEYLGNLVKSVEWNIKIIIEEGGVVLLFWLFKEGIVVG